MTPKPTAAANRSDTNPDLNDPLWFVVSCLLLLAVALLLLIVALSDRAYSSNLFAPMLAVLLVSLGFAVFLQIRSWHLGRRGFQAMESQFTSIYLHALDAILILN